MMRRAQVESAHTGRGAEPELLGLHLATREGHSCPAVGLRDGDGYDTR
jgi:hypothetical protein